MHSKNALGTSVTLNDGIVMPSIGLGTWENTGSAAIGNFKLAIKTGYRHIDTASLYGNEREVGIAVRECIDEGLVKRSDLFITTKIWRDDQPHAKKALDSSLERLGLEFVDLYLIHFPAPVRHQTWDAFVKVRDEGLARSIGVSNFMPHHLDALLKHSSVVPSVNQYEFTPFSYKPDLLALCKSKGIQVCSSSPLTRRAKLDDPTIARIAKAHKRSVAQVLLRWNLQHGVVPLPKSSNPGRMKENLDIYDFSLTESDMKTLDALDESFHVYPDPMKMP